MTDTNTYYSRHDELSRTTEPTYPFPHAPDCPGRLDGVDADLLLGGTAIWDGSSEYLDTWVCTECDVVAYEVFQSSGFVPADRDRETVNTNAED